MSKQIRNLGVFLLVCYTALFLQVNRLTVLDAHDLQHKPGNNRAVERDFARPRGTIESADGVVLAESVPSNDRFKFQRRYPTKDLFAYVTGYYAFQLGSTGVEREYNDELAGRTLSFNLDQLDDLFVDREQVGNVTLSVRNDVQQVAKDTLGDRAGSVVALDPRTGEILALWSTPSYDPNLLATHNFEQATANAKVLNEAKATRARTFQERRFPGSTFKVVTATAGVERGGVTADQPSYPVRTSYQAPGRGRPISNFGGESCGGTLFPILDVSCNSAFAQMGTEDVGAAGMTQTAEGFGFDRDIPLDLPGGVQSTFPVERAASAPVFLAQASIGQNDVQATPLQMAMVAAGVANGGKVMTPHVMREVHDEQGNLVKKYDQKTFSTPMSEDTAALLRDAMVSVVRQGTATRLAEGLDGFVVGGKTGTAQLGSNPPRSDAWIIGFAGPPGEVPHVVVAVNVEGQEGSSEATGGRVAAPIGAAVMKQALTPPQRADQAEGG